MVNDCHGADLLAYRLLGLSLRRFKGRAGVILACSSRHVFGLNSCGRFDWWWLRFDVIQDFLDDIWISDVSDELIWQSLLSPTFRCQITGRH